MCIRPSAVVREQSGNTLKNVFEKLTQCLR